ncbi:MAG: hypothetical protein AB8I08_23160 [Sandaracinaceae bacterium]
MKKTIVVAMALAFGGCFVSTPPAPPPPAPRPGPGPLPGPGPRPDPDAPLPEALVTDAPLLGGTMAELADGTLAIVDVSTGLVARVDPTTGVIVASTNVPRLDGPGRLAEDADGRLHLVLRASGELLTLDADLEEVTRRAVCQAPRGVVYDSEADVVRVACASGELVSFAPGEGEALASVLVEPDLRDLVIADGVLYASVFHRAELLTLQSDGTVLDRRAVPAAEFEARDREGAASTIRLDANTAYRIRALSDGRVLMVHQRSVTSPLDVENDGYAGGMCRGGVVESVVSVFTSGVAEPSTHAVGLTVVPLDGAYLPETDSVLVVSGANDSQGFFPSYSPRSVPLAATEEDCHFPEMTFEGFGSPSASTTSVEVLRDGRVAIQRRGGPTLVDVWEGGVQSVTVAHPNPVRPNAGSELFHALTPTFVACASCHPEAGEDGLTWNFLDTGPRRTQSLLGGLLDTAPFHWSGDQPTLSDIMAASFAERMGGRHTAEGTAAVGLWLDAQPMPEGPVHDEAAWARGDAVFQSSCASCHAGDALTDNQTVDVGTGGSFQVPSLRGVAYRAPFLHHGCADSLSALLDGDCGDGSAHRVESADRDDLLVYLRSL